MSRNYALSADQQRDYDGFRRIVLKQTGIDLGLYKTQQMVRRLEPLVQRAGRTSFTEYGALIRRNAAELACLLDRMTINVSELFRNPEKWRDLSEVVLPELLSRNRSLRIWSAGCSFGAEPYTIAMILEELSPGARHYLLATDIDEGILKRSRSGRFAAADIRNVPEALRSRYLVERAEGVEVAPRLRERITFRQHNLLSDPFEQGFDLIVCRNVVIYFTDAAKETLFARFSEALRPGGVIFVGGTERIFNAQALDLESRLPFFYRKKLVEARRAA